MDAGHNNNNNGKDLTADSERRERRERRKKEAAPRERKKESHTVTFQCIFVSLCFCSFLSLISEPDSHWRCALKLMLQQPLNSVCLTLLFLGLPFAFCYATFFCNEFSFFQRHSLHPSLSPFDSRQSWLSAEREKNVCERREGEKDGDGERDWTGMEREKEKRGTEGMIIIGPGPRTENESDDEE